MAGYRKELLEETIKIWQPYAGEKLTMADAEEINDNLFGLFRLLDRLNKKYPAKIAENTANIRKVNESPLTNVKF